MNPNIIMRIAQHEWRAIVDSKFSRGMFIALLLLLGAAFISGWRERAEIDELRDQAQRSQRRHWVERKSDSAHSAAHAGITVFRPYPVLGAIDPGLHPYSGTAVFLEAHRRNDLAGAPIDDYPGVLRMSLLSVAGVLQFIVPLVLVVLLAPAFAGEVEGGTLRMLEGMGANRFALLTGKFLGIAGPIIGLALVALALVAVSIPATEWPRLLLMIVAYLAYLSAIAAVLLGISAWARSARTAFAIGVAGWVLTCFLIPRGANEIAGRAIPTPPAYDMSAGIERIEQSMVQSRYFDRRKQIEAELMRKYSVSSVKELPVSPSAMLLMEWEELTTKVQNASYQDLYARQRMQYVWVQAAGFLAPTSAIETVSMALSGADPQHLHHFSDYADQYRFRITQALNQDLFQNSAPGKDRQRMVSEFQARQRQLYESIPPFDYRPPPLGWALTNVRLGALALALWLVVGLCFTCWSVRHMRVV
ncbi:MAG TPA: ABC transporter permease subunit [Bryobacteraceae bacterium]|nr:ABC transporter permease subunit [Bryobacteraceae bacterium]